MERKYQCEYRSPTTRRQCRAYADIWIELPKGSWVASCEKHFGSVKRIYESKYGSENIKIHRRLME